MQKLKEQIIHRPKPGRAAAPRQALFRTKSAAVQGLMFAAVFAAGIGAGWLSVRLGGLSGKGGAFLSADLSAILVIGYWLWLARLRALVFTELGKGILWALLLLILKRRRPTSLDDVLPSSEKRERMVVRARRAASSFPIVAIPVAATAGLGAAFFLSQPALWLRATIPPAACLLWGGLLGRLARRGFLPILQERR